MVTQEIRTPGVHILLDKVQGDPARVLRTGVPVFLGLIMRADLDRCNERLQEDEQYELHSLAADPSVSVVRRRGHVRQPPRHYSPVLDPELGDPSSQKYGYQSLRAGGPMPAKASVAQGPPLSADSPAFSAKPQRFTLWPQFEDTYGDLRAYGFLACAVRGFFENEGDLCYVQVACFEQAPDYGTLTKALATLAPYDEYDLVCVPDLAWLAVRAAQSAKAAALPGRREEDARAAALEFAVLQAAVLEHCDTTGDRMAILDALNAAADGAVLDQRRVLTSNNGTLYYPWVRVAQGPDVTGGCVPPCGHVAGVYNRCDRQTGVHKAPANELLAGVIDLPRLLNDGDQAPLNNKGVNCLRVFVRRGVRVWGARTLGSLEEWQYINVRRVFLTAGRWIERNMGDVVFEPHTPSLWVRVERDLTAYFTDLARRGALLSPATGAGFYVKCDAETNPPAVREAGCIVTEIGFAAPPPAEYIVIRIIHGPAGVQIESQAQPAA